jgi:carboxylate-amine ligase
LARVQPRSGRRLGGGEPYGVPPAPVWAETPELTVAAAAEAFAHERPYTVGVEEELLLTHADSLELAPAVDEALAELGDDPRFTRELRPVQIETVTGICDSAAAACHELSAARRDLIGVLGSRYRLLACGTHPFSSAWGEVTEGERYRRIADEYTWAAQRSLACGLHVHVAVGDADRALAVFNALRSYLPEIAALGANSAFFEGRPTGMSSIRPKLNEAFPRSGVPPAFPSWEAVVEFANWGRSGGLFPDATHFWWELRPHVVHGTLELRVADTQTRVEDAGGIVALIQALVVLLSERFDAGEPLPLHETHFIAENAWRAHRYGVGGWLVDLDTGEPQPTRERIARLLADVEPFAAELGAADQLAAVRTLLAGNGADRQQYVYEREGILGLTRWLVAETEAPALDA